MDATPNDCHLAFAWPVAGVYRATSPASSAARRDCARTSFHAVRRATSVTKPQTGCLCHQKTTALPTKGATISGFLAPPFVPSASAWTGRDNAGSRGEFRPAELPTQLDFDCPNVRRRVTKRGDSASSAPTQLLRGGGTTSRPSSSLHAPRRRTRSPQPIGNPTFHRHRDEGVSIERDQPASLFRSGVAPHNDLVPYRSSRLFLPGVIG